MGTESHIAIPAEEPAEDIYDRFERLGGDGLIHPGDYWRTRVAVSFSANLTLAFGRRRGSHYSSYEADAGEVLLIADVRKDGEQDHAIVLVPHPLKGSPEDRIRILASEFLDKFVYEPNGEAVREAEMAKVNVKIAEVQGQLTEAQRNPAYLNAQCLEALANDQDKKSPKTTLPALQEQVNILNVLKVESPSLSDALTSAANIEQTLDRIRTASSIAQAQGDWFKAKAERLGQLTSELAPFYIEKAQVALARTSQAVSRAQVLLESVQTLTLFTGEDVNVHPICDGEAAPVGTPIHLFQRKLWADEELSYRTVYVRNEINSTRSTTFAACLREDPELVHQLIPAPRGVVLMGYTKHHRHIADPYLDEITRKRNERSWLLVRDGQKVWIIDSPVDSHEGAKRLFPEKDVDGSIFGGVDGKRITPEDLRWTDKLDDLHYLSVHYRRFAVMLSGLISRGVFFNGIDFADLFYGSAVDRTFRLVFDDSGEDSLPNALIPLDEFFERCNGDIRTGSQLMVDWSHIMSPESTPSLYRRGRDRGRDREYTSYTPLVPYGPAIVEREGDTLYVSGKYSMFGAPKDVRVKLFERGKRIAGEYSFFCIDRLDIPTMNRLMASRDQRTKFLNFMGLFRRAINHAEEIAVIERPIRSHLTKAIVSAGLASEQRAQQIVEESMAAWRADGQKVPKVGSAEETTLLDRVFRLTEKGRVDVAAVENVARARGLVPLQLAIEADGRILLYTEPQVRDDRVARQVEVTRWVVKPGIRSLSLTAAILAPLYSLAGDQTVLHEWPGADTFKASGIPSILLPRKQKLLEEIEGAGGAARRLFAGPLADDEARQFIEEYAVISKAEKDKQRRSRYYRAPMIYALLPLAMARTSDNQIWMIYAKELAVRALGRNLPDGDRRKQLLAVIGDGYRLDEELRQHFNKAASEPTLKGIVVVAVPAKQASFSMRMVAGGDWRGMNHVTHYEYDGTRRYRTAARSDLQTIHLALTTQRILDYRVDNPNKAAASDWREVYGSIASRDIVSCQLPPGVDLARKAPFVSWLTSRNEAPPEADDSQAS